MTFLQINSFKKIYSALVLTSLLIVSSAMPVHHHAVAATCPADLVINSFQLTNAAGQVKTNFAVNEKIFVKVTFKNQGTDWARSSNGHTFSAFYSHKPSVVTWGAASDSSMYIKNGLFPNAWVKEYGSYASHPNYFVFEQAKSWSKASAGTYVARAYFNYNSAACEKNFSNNQATVSYTVGSPAPSPAPTPKPASTPTPKPTPTPAPTSANYNKVKLTPTSFTLVDVNGHPRANNVFKPNEPIYIKATIANTGTISGISGISTQIYAHRPQPVATGAKDAPEFSLLHGAFLPTTANNPNLYQSTPGHWSLNRFVGSTRSISQSQEGTYTARLFVDAAAIEKNDNPADNQLTATYIIATPQPGTRLQFDAAKFRSYGFPNPQSPNPISLSGETLHRYQDFMMRHAVKAQDLTGVDAGLIAAWAFRENSFDSYMDNCNDKEFSPNTPCYNWGVQWQVGYGNHVATGLDFILEGMNLMHPGQTAQQVGQKVINDSATRYSPVLKKAQALTYPSAAFGSHTTAQIRTAALKGDVAMRHRAAILMKDDALGTYLIARNFKDYIKLNSGLAARMESWGSYYKRQTVINSIKAVYDAGIYR